MANNRPANNPLPMLPAEMFDQAMPQAVNLSVKEVSQMMGRMACTSTLWNAQLQDKLNKRKLESFLSAVIDDDRKMVQGILNKNPELLFIDPPANLVIESQHTWNKFYAESALNMAAKRKQIEMIKIMMPYSGLWPFVHKLTRAPSWNIY